MSQISTKTHFLVLGFPTPTGMTAYGVSDKWWDGVEPLRTLAKLLEDTPIRVGLLTVANAEVFGIYSPEEDGTVDARTIRDGMTTIDKEVADEA